MYLNLWSKVSQIFLFYLYFSSLNLKYLKLIKMELTRFAMNSSYIYIYIVFLFSSMVNIKINFVKILNSKLFIIVVIFYLIMSVSRRISCFSCCDSNYQRVFELKNNFPLVDWINDRKWNVKGHFDIFLLTASLDFHATIHNNYFMLGLKHYSARV